MAVGIHHQNQLVNRNIADLIIRPGVDQTASHYLVSSSLCPFENFHQTDKNYIKLKLSFILKKKKPKKKYLIFLEWITPST